MAALGKGRSDRDAAVTTVNREDIKVTTQNAVDAFIRVFGRAPNQTECAIIVSAIIRYFDAPDAPTTRLQ
jgi:hypothetical protein